MRHIIQVLGMLAVASLAGCCMDAIRRDVSAHDLYERVRLELPQYMPEIETVAQSNRRFFQFIRAKLGRPTLCTSNEIVYLNRPEPGADYPPLRPMIVFQQSEDGRITNCCYRGTYNPGVTIGTYIDKDGYLVRGRLYGPPGYDDAEGHFVEHGAMIWQDENGKVNVIRYIHGKEMPTPGARDIAPAPRKTRNVGLTR